MTCHIARHSALCQVGFRIVASYRVFDHSVHSGLSYCLAEASREKARRTACLFALSALATLLSRQGSQYFRRAKSRRVYAARGFLLSPFTEKESKRHQFGSKWEKRGLKGNLGRRIFAHWRAFSPVKKPEIPVVLSMLRHLHSLVSQLCVMVASVVVFGLLATGIRVTMDGGAFPGYCNNALDALAP